MSAPVVNSPPADATVTDAKKAEDYQRFVTLIGSDVEKGATKFDDRVRRDYRLSVAEFWLVAALSNGLLWTQIVVGAALTALGASDRPGTKTATIYLGAVSTIIAGLLTYFKSRNQPNRSRQKRYALRNVRNKMDEALAEFQSTSQYLDPNTKAQEIIRIYDQAIADAEANHPDLWITLGDLKGFLPKLPPAAQVPNTTGTNTTTNTSTGVDANGIVVPDAPVAKDTTISGSSLSPSSSNLATQLGEKGDTLTVDPTSAQATKQNGHVNVAGADQISSDGPPAFSEVPQRPVDVHVPSKP